MLLCMDSVHFSAIPCPKRDTTLQTSPAPRGPVRKVLILQSHPDPDSFGAALGAAYGHGAASAGAGVTLLSLGSLSFDPILHGGFRGDQPLEPDLVRAREAIEAADHLVFQFPVWWGNLPALLKGFVDRLFLPGWAFQQVPGRALPRGLLAGRSARVVSTMDSPWWWYRIKHGRAAHRALIGATLHYVGITEVQQTTVYRLRTLSAEQRAGWIARVERQGAADAARPARPAPHARALQAR